MNRSTLSCAAAAAAACVLAAVVPSADAAAPGKAGVHRASVSTHPTTSSKAGGVIPSAVSGYQFVLSDTLTDSAGTQTSGDAKCARGSKVIGGGAVIQSSSLTENINGSVPHDNRTWRAYVNNSGATDGTFVVYAVCATTVPGYVQVSTDTGVDDPAGSQVTATVACPSGKVPLGGGGLGSSFDTQVNLNTSIPQTAGWRVDVNNNSADGNSAYAYAVCATAPPRYSQVAATSSATVGAGAQQNSQARCPGGTVVLGGGMFSGSASVLFDLNSTFPNSTHVWKSYANNNSANSSSIRAYAVCGKATAPVA